MDISQDSPVFKEAHNRNQKYNILERIKTNFECKTFNLNFTLPRDPKTHHFLAEIFNYASFGFTILRCKKNFVLEAWVRTQRWKFFFRYFILFRHFFIRKKHELNCFLIKSVLNGVSKQ